MYRRIGGASARMKQRRGRGGKTRRPALYESFETSHGDRIDVTMSGHGHHRADFRMGFLPCRRQRPLERITDTFVKRGILLFHAIDGAARLHAMHRHIERHVQQEREVRRPTSGGQRIHPAQRIQRQSTSRALVGIRGQQKPIDEHHRTTRECGLHHLVHQLRARCGKEQRFRGGYQ